MEGVKQELDIDTQGDFDYALIRNNRELLAPYFCTHTKVSMIKRMPEVFNKNGQLKSGYQWLDDWNKDELFKVLYENRSILKTILEPCLWLKSPPVTSPSSNTPSTSKKRASSPTRDASAKRPRTTALRNAQPAQIAANESTLPIEVDDIDCTALCSDTDRCAQQSPVSATENISPPVQEKKKKKAKKDRGDNTPPQLTSEHTLSPQVSTREQEGTTLHPSRLRMLSLGVNDASEHHAPSESTISYTTRTTPSAGRVMLKNAARPVTVHSATSTPGAPPGLVRGGSGWEDFDAPAARIKIPSDTRYNSSRGSRPEQHSSSLANAQRGSFRSPDQSVDNYIPAPARHFDRSRTPGRQNNAQRAQPQCGSSSINYTPDRQMYQGCSNNISNNQRRKQQRQGRACYA